MLHTHLSKVTVIQQGLNNGTKAVFQQFQITENGIYVNSRKTNTSLAPESHNHS